MALMGIVAFANSGPTYWERNPSSETLVIDQDSPIEVKNETLVFDINYIPNHEHLLSADVTATYIMYNPISEAKQVQMAFPFVSTLNDLDINDIWINVDGEPLSYTIYPGEIVENQGDTLKTSGKVTYSFDQIVESLIDTQFTSDILQPETIGTLYTITTQSGQSTTKMIIKLDINSDDTYVISSGFNEIERIDGNISLCSLCDPDQSYSIFVFGGGAKLDIKGYSDWEMSQELDIEYTQNSSEITYETFFETTILDVEALYSAYRVSNGYKSPIEYMQKYNMYAKRFVEEFIRSNNVVNITTTNGLMDEWYDQRIFTLLYTVDFEPESGHEVSVAYKAPATMDLRNNENVDYTFEYVLNPAQYWKSFGTLTIEIHTSDNIQGLVDSSIEFDEIGDGSYETVLDKLPEADLYFKLQGPRLKNLPNESKEPEITEVEDERVQEKEDHVHTLVYLILLGVGAVTVYMYLVKRQSRR